MLQTSPQTTTDAQGLFSNFHSQTYGDLDMDGVVAKLLEYCADEPSMKYELIIGSDSFGMAGSAAAFVSAIVVHRKTKGGIYFWSKRIETGMHTMQQRIWQEALFSIRLAEKMVLKLKEKNVSDFSLTIHADIGPNGETKLMMNEIVGMIRGNGFAVKTKPDSYGASSVADRHT